MNGDRPAASVSLPVASTSSRKALGNSAILASYYAVDAGMLFLLNLILARYLGLAGFGKFSFALSYGLILSSLDPGFQLILTKFVARNPDISNPWISGGISIRVYMTGSLILLGSLPLFLSGLLAVEWIADFHGCQLGVAAFRFANLAQISIHSY